MEDPKRGYLTTVLSCRCPRCREGKLFKYSTTINFKHNLEMNEHCPVCGQPTDIEVGFYYGTSYVSYTLGVLISAAFFILWWLIIGFSYEDNRFFWCIGIDVVLLLFSQLWLMRLSRSFWLSWFVKYDPDWQHTKPQDLERINREQQNNW
ncbi:MAG: DUF983 domain-containing protein [Chitinophagaceae bacterium]